MIKIQRFLKGVMTQIGAIHWKNNGSMRTLEDIDERGTLFSGIVTV